MGFIRAQNTPYCLETSISKCDFRPLKLPGLLRKGPQVNKPFLSSWHCTGKACFGVYCQQTFPAFQQTIAPSQGQGGQIHNRRMAMFTPTSFLCYCLYALKWDVGKVYYF